MADQRPEALPRRLYVAHGKVYLIRDVYDGPYFVGPEYATLDKDAQLVWHPSLEGADFELMQPLGEVEP